MLAPSTARLFSILAFAAVLPMLGLYALLMKVVTPSPDGGMEPTVTMVCYIAFTVLFTALIIVGIAGSQVGPIFIFRTFIMDVPKDLFEAAEIDGASHLQQMRNVVLPLSGPIIATVAIQQFVHHWNEFLLPLIIMRDNSKLPITVQLLRMSGEYFKLWGPLMAGYALASIPVILLFIFAMRFFIRGVAEGGTKY